MRLVSPDEMLAAAKEQQLGGREPETEYDWQEIINFVAANLAVDLKTGISICRLMKLMYDIPVSDEAIEEIARFQLVTRARYSSN